MSDEANTQVTVTESDAAEEITVESVVEAVLLSTDAPLSGSKLARIVGTGDARDVKQHIATLNERYTQMATSFRIQEIAKGYQILTLPQYNHWVQKLHKSRAESRLSPAALETLAVVAYKQPVLRAVIESIRGVAVGDMLVRLRDVNLVKIVGRAEEIGRPLLYGTTNRFLEVFGLASLKDLPPIDDTVSGTVPQLRPVEYEAPVEAETPDENEVPDENEAPVEIETPIENEAPVENEAPIDNDAPAEDETPVDPQEE